MAGGIGPSRSARAAGHGADLSFPTAYQVQVDPAYGLDVEIDLGGASYAEQWRFVCREESRNP